jgi:hypothetical protein
VTSGTIPIDWLAVLSELRAHGLSGADIGRAIDVPTGTVTYWLQGYCPADMRHSRAVRLLALLESTRAAGVSIRPTDPGDAHGQVPKRPSSRR